MLVKAQSYITLLALDLNTFFIPHTEQVWQYSLKNGNGQ